MEATLEVRWYVKGRPPATVKRWFEFECPGKLLDNLEIRKDWYACFQPDQLSKFVNFSKRALNREEVNLKLRQGNLELKLRKQEFGSHRFSCLQDEKTCEGKVEQWCKFGERELKESNLVTSDLLNKLDWVGVDKKREQKIEQGVKSELSCLEIEREYWWTIAFEANHDIYDGQNNSCFEEVVSRACQTYSGSKLSAINSYGYSKWLLELEPKTAIALKFGAIRS